MAFLQDILYSSFLLIISNPMMCSTQSLGRNEDSHIQISRYRRSTGKCGNPLNVQCCPGTNGGCNVGGCYCDEYCMQANDCCDDYIQTCQNGPCNSYSIIANESKRSSDYVTDISSDIYISDDNLTDGWYRITSANGGVMPRYPPGYLHCGTQNPIWLNGSLPSIEDGNVTVEGCVQTLNGSCEDSLDIGVTNCSEGFYVFYLRNTSLNSAYCFGKGPVICYDGLSSETGYYPGCSSSFPHETVHPVVQAILIEGNISNIPLPNPGPSLHSVFRCYFDNVSNNTYLYDVNWYINGENVTVFKNIPFDLINTTFLNDNHWTKKFKMNMEVSCSVRLRYRTDSLPSPFFTSSVFKAGLYPERYEYTVIEGESINIAFYSTVPVACIASNPDIGSKMCDQTFYLSQPKYDNDEGVTCSNNIVSRDIIFETQFCGLVFNSLNWKESRNLTVYGFVDGLYNNQDRSTFIQLSATSVSVFDEKWVGIQIPEIKVTVLDKDSVMTGRVCQSYNDPHITTFDGNPYHYMEVGEFVMYRNDIGPYWVHALFTNCGWGWSGSSCHCGIAVRSHNSLFVFRTCEKISRTQKYMLPRPHIEEQSCYGSHLSIEHHGNSYSITLPIGTEIRFSYSTSSQFINNISIKPSVFDIDQAKGLCGVPSATKDPSDDFTNRDLEVVDEKTFADSWRIDSNTMPQEHLFGEDLHFLSDSSSVVVETENQNNKTFQRHYCACEKQAQTNSNLEDFYTLQCNLTEKTQQCISNSASDKDSMSSVMTSCPGYNRRKRSAHRIIRRSVTDSDDIVDVSPLEFDNDINTEVQEAEFRDGWNEEEANRTCTEKIHQAVPVDVFGVVAGLTDTEYIQSCILDIKYTANTQFIKETVGAMQTYTVMEVSRNETLALQQTEDGSQTILEYVTALLCPNNCSENGNCSSGVCSCFDGYIGEDCSEDIWTPPQNISLPSDGLCGTRTRTCLRTNIYGVFPSQNVWCKRRHFQISSNVTTYSSNVEIFKAQYRNTFMVSVSLESSRRKRSIADPLVSDGYEIRLSNDGQVFGEPVNIIIYDEECQDCQSKSLTCVMIDSCPEFLTTEQSTSTDSPNDATTFTVTKGEHETTLDTTLTYSTSDEIKEQSTTQEVYESSTQARSTTKRQLTTMSEETTERSTTPLQDKTTERSSTLKSDQTIIMQSTQKSDETTERPSTSMLKETTERPSTPLSDDVTEMQSTSMSGKTTEVLSTAMPGKTTEKQSTPIPDETTEKQMTALPDETTLKSSTARTTTESMVEKTIFSTPEGKYETTRTTQYITTPQDTSTSIETRNVETTSPTAPFNPTTVKGKIQDHTTKEAIASSTQINDAGDTGKENLKSYIGPFIGAGSVVFFLVVVIFVCIGRKMITSKQSNKKRDSNILSNYEDWTIYTGRMQDIRDVTNKTSKQGFHQATRINTGRLWK